MRVTFRPKDTPGRDIWRPDADVAHAFAGTAEVFSQVLRTDSGISLPVDGVCVIDFQDFRALCAAAVHRFSTSDQGILRSLALGFISTSLVLVDRAGHPLPSMPGPAQERAWVALRQQHARAMPV